MMALHWFPDHRRRYERHLLDHYHAELLAHGVTGYDRYALDDDYRLSVLWQIATPVWQAWNNIPSGIWWPHRSASSWQSTISGAAICSLYDHPGI